MSSLVSIRDLRKTYQRGAERVQVLHGIDLEIPEGDFVALMGPSGSGKSSTSRGVASRLGLRYLDTGAQFRAITWWMLDQGVDVRDAAAVAARCEEPVVESGTDQSACEGAPVTAAARPRRRS